MYRLRTSTPRARGGGNLDMGFSGKERARGVHPDRIRGAGGDLIIFPFFAFTGGLAWGHPTYWHYLSGGGGTPPTVGFGV